MGEKHRPKSQEWQEFANEIQSDVEQTLEDLQIDIELANDQLQQAYLDGSDSISNLTNEIITFLDKRWGYNGDIFMVTGKWLMPSTVAITDTGISCEQEKLDAFNIARSNGFMVGLIEEGESTLPKIGMSFVVAETYLGNSKLQGNFEFLAFALPSEISVQFMRPRGPETVGASADEVSAAIANADAMLLAYINHDCSSFYKASAAKQGNFLQSVIDSAAWALPTKNSLDRVTIKDTSVSELFIHDANSKKIFKLNLTDNTPIQISHGVILDFTTIDTLRDGVGKVRYEDPEDLATYNLGLCAVVSPNNINIDLSKLNNPDIIVPFRRILGQPTICIE